MFWPTELSAQAARLSIIPKLLETQNEFIAILSVPVPTLEAAFQIVQASSLSGNLFLKHLTILADFGGEQLQRVNSNFAKLFPEGQLAYLWNNEIHTYTFQKLPVPNLSNDKLGISGKRLLKNRALDGLLQDIAALLIFGSACIDESAARILGKCEIGEYLGHPERLAKFIKQRYIWVSRITMGSKANNLGQLAQQFVLNYLQDNLGIANAEVHSNATIPGITHTDPRTNRPTSFDIVVAKGEQYAAIEVSFQVTTNSTIERKAGQAQARYRQIEAAGYKIAYVIDGAGNFQRETALRTICSFSHCTVTFSRQELDVLCQFLREYFQ